MGISIAARRVRHGRLRKVVMRLRTVTVTVARCAAGTAPDITCHGLIRAGRAAFPPADLEVSALSRACRTAAIRRRCGRRKRPRLSARYSGGRAAVAASGPARLGLRSDLPAAVITTAGSLPALDSGRLDRPRQRHRPMAPHRIERLAPPDAECRSPGSTPPPAVARGRWLTARSRARPPYWRISASLRPRVTPSAAAGCPPGGREPRSPGNGGGRRASG